MKNEILCRGWGLWLGWFLLACGTPEESPTAGSNTNWLVHCDSDQDCGQTSRCLCGGCTRECQLEEDCNPLLGAKCVRVTDDAALVGCGAIDESGPASFCLPNCQPGSCGPDMLCSLGSCVPFLVPRLPLCSALGTSDSVLEDQLLLEVETTLASGNVSCPDGSSLLASALVAVDPELACAARALAADIQQTRSPSLIDSEGRGTSQRLEEVGVTASRWAEGFAFGVDAATSAITRMLSDTDFCTAFVGGGFAGIGVGVYGDSFVVLLAGP